MGRPRKILTKTLESVDKGSRPEDIIRTLGNRLKNKFSLYKRLRRLKETEWAENLRQHKGVYDPEVLAKLDANSSKVYPKVTRSKDNLVLSKLHEMLFAATDRNWSIEPTPVPSVSPDVANGLAQALIRQDPQTGQMIMPTAKDLKKAISDYTKRTSEDMQAEMDDQFLEMRYTVKVGKPVLRSGILYGTGVAKGPLVEKSQSVDWEYKRSKWVKKEVEVNRPYYQFISVWSWYPDMTVTEQEDMEGSFERHIYTKHQVRQMMSLAGFNQDQIRQYLLEHPNGDYIPEPWEQDVRDMSRDVSQGSGDITESGDYINTFDGSMGEYKFGNKYEVLEYWGYVDGYELRACGETITDAEVENEVHANVWLLGGIPIKAVVNPEPNRKDVYKLFYYEKDETSIFGEGLPRVIRHSQLSISAAARMMLNNASICSGPMFEVNTDLVDTDLCNPLDIHPMKIWLRSGRGVESQYQGLRIYSVDSHISEYIAIINQFQQFGDIEATLPTWMIAEPQKSANETAGAVSMKMGTITISLRDLVRNFDDYTEDVVDSLYMWNMEFNPRQDIKGDYKVKAHGSTTLITKEVRMNGLNMFAATMQPEDWAYVPRRDFLEERIKTSELPISLRTEEEAQAYIQSMKDEEADALAKEAAKADIKKTKAMALNLLHKAQAPIPQPDVPGVGAVPPPPPQVTPVPPVQPIGGMNGPVQEGVGSVPV